MVEFTRSLGAATDVGYQIMEELDNPSKLPDMDIPYNSPLEE